MKNNFATIRWAGELLTLLPERAIWWERRKTLFIADPHFGKASTFRRAGIPVPESSHDDDLLRLEKLSDGFAAQQLVILGDFFHARAGRSEATLSALRDWRERHRHLEITLVPGNHDRHAGAPPAEWSIHCVREPWPLAPFVCCHEPTTISDSFVLSGHWHPSLRLNDRMGSGLNVPCFYFSDGLAVLPAYGNFTGLHPVSPKSTDRVFLVGPDEVVEFNVRNYRAD